MLYTFSIGFLIDQCQTLLSWLECSTDWSLTIIFPLCVRADHHATTKMLSERYHNNVLRPFKSPSG
uniref:Uncharacterized protein n=1 Tax=Nelumbo nucifera TaxID=4432 RepID=A0A822XLE5_NELNU|nr:TPA_asm: hypothetical protein HUJ06_021229 [Nelumbo nucifera]